jgi:hypothetical protein
MRAFKMTNGGPKNLQTPRWQRCFRILRPADVEPFDRRRGPTIAAFVVEPGDDNDQGSDGLAGRGVSDDTK